MAQQYTEDRSNSESPIIQSQEYESTATTEESSMVDSKKGIIDSKQQDHRLYLARQQTLDKDIDEHQHPSEPPMYSNGQQNHFFQQQNAGASYYQHQYHAECYYGGQPAMTMTMGPPMYNDMPAYYQQIYTPFHVPIPVPVPVLVVHQFVRHDDANSTYFNQVSSPARRRFRKSRSNDKMSGTSPTASTSSSEGVIGVQRTSNCEASDISMLSHPTSSTPANSPMRRRMRGRKNSRQALPSAINEDEFAEGAASDAGGLMHGLENVEILGCDAVLTQASTTPGTTISDEVTFTL
jgi:hypothetical protein